MPALPLLHLVVLAWAFTAILGRLISLPSPDLVVWRTGLAAAGFAVLALSLRAPLRLARRDALLLSGLGGILGIHWVLFFLSGRMATVSVSLAAMPTMMIWCSLLEPIVTRRYRWSFTEFATGCVVVASAWMIYAVEPAHRAGFTTGLLSAFLAALYSVINKQVVSRYRFASLCSWQLGGAFLTTWLLLPFAEGRMVPAAPGAADWGWLMLLAFGCTILPYAAFVHVMRRLPVFTINVVYNLEPLYGMVLAALVFGSRERMTPGFYAGAAIIIAVVLAVPWLQAQARRGTCPDHGLES